MLPFRARGQRGITLIEIMLWCAIIAGATAAVFIFSKKATVTAAVETEQRQVEDIVKTVESLFATQPNFAALGTNGAAYLNARGATRSGLKLSSDGEGNAALITALGNGQLNLSAWDVVPVSGPVVPNSGYRLAYQGLTASECTRLVTATYPVAYQVSIGHNGLDDGSATDLALRGRLTGSPDAIAESCAGGTPTAFLYFAPARAIAATTPTTPPPAARCAPVHETQHIACPAGQIGTISQERDGACTGPGNTIVYTAWTTADDTCAPPPAGSPSVIVPSSPDDCAIVTFSEVGACPLGQTGHVLRTRTHDTCAGTYSPWTVASDSCVTPTTGVVCTPGAREQTIACPAGMTGAIVQTQSSHCTSQYGSPVWPTTWETISNTCTGSGGMCTVQREVGPIPCGAGSYGPWDGQHERLLNCVNATTQSPSWTAYSVLTPNLGCASCPATITEPSTTWAASSTACPSGYTGSQDWEYELVSTRTVSYNCPTGTTSIPSPSYSAWSSPVATGATRNFVDSCTPVATCSGNSSETQNVSTSGGCPSGYTGNQTWDRAQARSRTCNSGTWSAWSAWADTGSTSNFVDNCVVSTCSGASTQNQWLSTSSNCPAGSWGGTAWEYEQIQSRTCTSGTWGAWGSWSNSGATRNASGSCTACPSGSTESSTQWVASSAACPSGQTGSHSWEREQTHSRSVSYSCPAGTTSSPSPSYGSWSAWADTGNTRNTNNTCAPSTPTMCAVQTSFSSGLENGGDGQQTISYSLSSPPTYEDFTCFERDGCNPGTVLAPALTLYAWGALCQPGDTYMTVDRPFGYTTTDWVTSFTYEFACEPVSAGNCY